jgi:hypothetical protein
VLADFHRNGLLYAWIEGFKKFGHWIGSEKPGRLPIPSHKDRYSTCGTKRTYGSLRREIEEYENSIRIESGWDPEKLQVGLGLGLGFPSNNTYTQDHLILSLNTSECERELPQTIFSKLGISLDRWMVYKTMRIKIHRPIVPGAEEPLLAELETFENPVAVLEQAIATSSYKFYPVGGKANGNGQHKLTATELAMHNAKALGLH